MNRLFIALALVLVSGMSFGQTKEEAQRALDNLIGGKWELKGFWSNGTKFNQDFEVTKILNNNIYKVVTYGNVSSKGYEKGIRNEGVRGWNNDTNQMEFSEADCFGGFISGRVTTDGLDIYYEYEYGGQTMTDAWVFKGPDTYEFIIGVREDGQWTNVEVNGGIRRIR